MLASPGETPIKSLGTGWVFEPKYDGIRCISANGRLYSRSGQDISRRFPEIQAPANRIFDGEIVMLVDGVPSFQKVSKRTAANARHQEPARFMVFDMLEVSGLDLTPYRQIERRNILAETFLPDNCDMAIWSNHGPSMWDTMMTFGMEGVMAKHDNAKYLPGRRSPMWRKYKKSMRLSCIVTGVERGSGSRAKTFGALFLSVLDPSGDLVDIGKVGSGFSQSQLSSLTARINDGDVVLVDVECQELTNDRKLRFPVFAGVRDDLSVLDCTISQVASA